MSLDRYVRKDDGNIIVEIVNCGEITIPLTKRDSHMKILAWTNHLARNREISCPVLLRFISLACSEPGLALPDDPNRM